MTDPRRQVPSLEAHIRARLTSDGSAVIPPRIARWLEQNSGMTDDRRARLRHTDPDAYVALTALHLAGLRSDSGTKDAGTQQHTEESKPQGGWMSTSEAAEAFGVTDRCIRKWCRSGRLRAGLSGHRWLIDPRSANLPTQRGEQTT